jgi:chitin disaccharide deacetylase
MSICTGNSPESSDSLLRRLGFSATDRVVIVHADDIGMCHATVRAYEDLLDFGLISSASVMVPCPWFPAIAAYCRIHPGTDIGVHLTLTSEWEHYRWRPISSGEPDCGLTDSEGFLHRRVSHLEQRASSGEVLAEMRAQLARARQFGIQPTHLDAHMYALQGRFLPDFASFALAERLPALITQAHLSSACTAPEVRTGDLPVFDHLAALPDKGDPADRMGAVKAMVDMLPCGVSCLLLHPAQDTPELRAIVPNWRYRVADLIAFTNAELKRHIKNAGIQIIGYRALEDAMR